MHVQLGGFIRDHNCTFGSDIIWLLSGNGAKDNNLKATLLNKQ